MKLNILGFVFGLLAGTLITALAVGLLVFSMLKNNIPIVETKTCGILVSVDENPEVNWYIVVSGDHVSNHTCEALAKRTSKNGSLTTAKVVSEYPLETVYCYMDDIEYRLSLVTSDANGNVGIQICNASPSDWVKTYK